LLVLAVPAAAPATVTVSRSEAALVVTGDAAADKIAIRMSVAREIDVDSPANDHFIVAPLQALGGATLAAGPGCEEYAPEPDYRQVRCPAGGVASVETDVGDGDDYVSVRTLTAPATLRAGAGDDGLNHDGNSAVSMFGDAGDDVINFMGGASTAYGGSGDDVFVYETTAATTAFGEAGEDRFDAASSRGRDTIDAGPDADRIDVRAGGADVVRCGGGVDRTSADPTDELASDCEPTVPGGDELDEAIAAAALRLELLTLRTLLRRGMTLSVPRRPPGVWTAELRARTGGRWTRIASGREQRFSPAEDRIVLRLNRAGRALARRAPRLRVRVRITFTSSSGRQSRTRTAVVRR
jgi:hypothetical protein